MIERRRKAGFTLIELLVVVAIIALLISILLPQLAGARESGKRAKCLSNMKVISQAMCGYSTEDKTEQLIPIQSEMLHSQPYWIWRTANWFSFGGRSGRIPFLTDQGNWILRENDPNDPVPPGYTLLPAFAARRRPLNLFMYSGSMMTSDSKNLEIYHCPSDTGYPNHPLIDDAPLQSANRPCYDYLGNSYRGSQFSLTWGGDHAPSQAVFALGPWGHRASTLQNPGRLITFGEPTFFNMIGQDGGGQPIRDPVIVMGWHKKRLIDNLGFADGSARPSKAHGDGNGQGVQYTGIISVDAATAMRMGLADISYISRGPSWTFDCYPTPGARIWGRGVIQAYIQGGLANLWPFRGYQDNMRVP